MHFYQNHSNYQGSQHTPNAAIIHTFGTLYTKQRVDKKLLVYLHKILNKPEENWVKKTLHLLQSMNIGWYKKVMSLLETYELPTDFHNIKTQPPRTWKTKIHLAIEKTNRERINQDCHKLVNGISVLKPKTKTIPHQLARGNYQRQPSKEILNLTKHETKTVLIARYGMLECGQNFKGTLKEICDQCHCLDDENHRLNFCLKWQRINLHNSNIKANFDDIFSDNVDVLRNVISIIEKVWNTKNAHGTMKTE